jgi:hypothetical protein
VRQDGDLISVLMGLGFGALRMNSPGQWTRLAMSAAIWVVAPLILGTIRVLRREVA